MIFLFKIILYNTVKVTLLYRRFQVYFFIYEIKITLIKSRCNLIHPLRMGKSKFNDKSLHTKNHSQRRRSTSIFFIDFELFFAKKYHKYSIILFIFISIHYFYNVTYT